ncbi:MAG: hypothetical protein UDB11_00720 [Peptococcaceae bacterium]|nr:hypothetical protein [Peptococcaceae bacterium]
MVQKGVITHFTNGMPVVRPYGSGDALTPPLVDGHRACGNAPQCAHIDFNGCPLPALAVGDVVAFAMFEDGTGIVLAKM